jgi:hypothetical protein
VVCGRVIEGRVLELYQELTDSPTSALEEACVLSAIFALRYLSRDIAANVEQIDVSFHCDVLEAALTVLILSIGNLAMDKKGGSVQHKSRPRFQHRGSSSYL